MGTRWDKVKRIDKEFDTIFRNRSHVFLVHYSCESFYDNPKDSFKIASIAVRSHHTGQTESFSIHLSAEEHSVDLSQSYEQAERKMLDGFYAFVKSNQNAYWVHWNMRDSNYGFKAIEHRYKVLGGTPIVISDNNKFDLGRMLVDRFTSKYIGHPRLAKLMEKNSISKKHFLSTLKKVDIFEDILGKIEDGDLKVKSWFFQIYGLNIAAINYFLYSHPFINFITLIAGIYGVYELILKFL